jgi:hypothetical protein
MTSTFNLAKVIHFTYFNIQYLEDLIIQEQLTGNPKQFINNIISRYKWCLNELYARMSSKGADLLRKEVEQRDIAAIDSIINLAIALPEDKRLELEEYLVQLTN